jgi:hypothetical protein
MLQTMVTRRAVEVRTLLARGTFDGARVPLRNGGTLPAAMFAGIALADLDHLTALSPEGSGHIGGMSWQQLAEDIELLHEVALARE